MPAVPSIARADCASQPASSLPIQPTVTHLKSSHGQSCLTRCLTSLGSTDLTTDAHLTTNILLFAGLTLGLTSLSILTPHTCTVVYLSRQPVKCCNHLCEHASVLIINLVFTGCNNLAGQLLGELSVIKPTCHKHTHLVLGGCKQYELTTADGMNCALTAFSHTGSIVN
ncbi:hypothetical protein BsWGS_26028 [Bradybaena similaris]